MSTGQHDNEVRWMEWSEKAFDSARTEGKLVLLDLTASWCHWCHVMDSTTYSNPAVVQLINDNFISIRVDIDRRPDISERYNRGGFPTTAFLSDRGESIWGGTYIPPADMTRIIGSILQAQRSGEIERALENNRMLHLDLSSAAIEKRPLGMDDLEDVFEDIFSAYDVEDGGFGIEPKFPHPDVIDLLLFRHSEIDDRGVVDAAVTTLKRMTEGLYDQVEGGVFRYSVTRDWRTPHFEKMLETNIGFLRNVVHAHMVTGEESFARTARGTAEFLLNTLRDASTGGFYGSQDADEEYYSLGIEGRMRRGRPGVDRTVYAGWNSDAASVMITAGLLLREPEWVDAGLRAWRCSVARLWNPEKKLVRHVEGNELYLLDDQVSFMNALIAVLNATGDESVIGLAEELVAAVDKSFSHPDGGYSDIMSASKAIGELGNLRRPLVSNSDWSLALAELGSITQNESLVDKARQVLSSFSRADIDAHGVFSAPYLRARWFLDRGPVVVDLRACPEKMHDPTELCVTALSIGHPAVVIRRSLDHEAKKPYAVVCVRGKCFPRTERPDRLKGILEGALLSLRQ